jgi:hypothetical protein
MEYRDAKRPSSPSTSEPSSDKDIFSIVFNDENLMRNILTCVGNFQYRWVGMVDRKFKKQYLKLFPWKYTHYCALTVGHTKVCLQESKKHNYLYIQAAKTGNIEVLQFLYSSQTNDANGTENQFNFICRVAADHEQFDTLKWIISNGYADVASVTEHLAGSGNIDMLHWAHEQYGCTLNERTVANAAKHGHMECVQWLHSTMNCPWDQETCLNAAKYGHLHVLKWVRERGCPWDNDTSSNAALHGHLEVVQWAHANGCPWIIETWFNAVKNGHLLVLQWLRANGCPMADISCYIAAQYGRLDVLHWLRSNGCRWDHRTCSWVAMNAF